MARQLAEVNSANSLGEGTGITTQPMPVQQASISQSLWFWFLILVGIAVCLFLVLLFNRLVQRSTENNSLQRRLVEMSDRHRAEVESARVDAVAQERERRQARIRQNPYAGPSVVAGGLPTGNLAADYLVAYYRRRYPNPVGADRLVRLYQVEPTWVRGANLQVSYAGDVNRTRDLVTDQPGWRGVFSNGVVLDVLQRCANGLFSEIGQQIHDNQVARREGVLNTVVNRAVWPELVDQPTVAPQSPSVPPVVATVVSTEPPIPPILRTMLPVDDSLPPNLVAVNELPVYDGIECRGNQVRLRVAGTENWHTHDLSVVPGSRIVIAENEIRLIQGEHTIMFGVWRDRDATPGQVR
jgi:hypothetical protein